MSHDEQAVREVIERWIAAVAASDLDGVLADHTADVVMFDVPPPDDGIRGIDAYRASWPAFLDWQDGDGCFELVRLDVTAGADVAFAHALLRCGTPSRSRRTRAGGYACPSSYGRTKAGGSLRTSTIRSRWRSEARRARRLRQGVTG